MLTITIIFLIFNLLVLSPVFFIALSKFFSDETFTYKKGLFLSIQILTIYLLFQVIILAVFWSIPSLSIIVSLILNLAILVVVVLIVKSKFKTTIPKAIAIQVINCIFAIIIAFSFKYFVCQAYKIPAGSNLPTILIGDQILVNKYIYKYRQPKRNEFIIFKFPRNEKIDYVKRIVAIPGDVIEIVNKKLILNHKPIEENFIINPDSKIMSKKMGPRDNFGPVTVPEESYFVLGDNRDNSFDSRFWGFVKKGKIKGRAEVIYFSFDSKNKSIRTERIGKSI